MKNQNLINARNHSELTLEQLAEKMRKIHTKKYISFSLISDWEHGRRNLSIPYAKTLGKILNVKFEKLFNEESMTRAIKKVLGYEENDPALRKKLLKVIIEKK